MLAECYGVDCFSFGYLFPISNFTAPVPYRISLSAARCDCWVTSLDMTPAGPCHFGFLVRICILDGAIMHLCASCVICISFGGSFKFSGQTPTCVAPFAYRSRSTAIWELYMGEDQLLWVFPQSLASYTCHPFNQPPLLYHESGDAYFYIILIKLSVIPAPMMHSCPSETTNA